MNRVIYTNGNDIKSEQLFSIAVQGDCEETPGMTPYIIYNGTTVTPDGSLPTEILECTVRYGQEVTLGIGGIRGFDTFLWDDGRTSSTVTKTVVLSRDVQLIYQNQGGRKTLFTFRLNCDGGAHPGVETTIHPQSPANHPATHPQSSTGRANAYDLQGRQVDSLPAIRHSSLLNKTIYIKNGNIYQVRH